MASAIPKKPRTQRSSRFHPDIFFSAWQDGRLSAPKANEFRSCITTAFDLQPGDSFVYRAVAEVTLAQVQAYIDHGDRGRLLEWYRDQDGNKLEGPPDADISAYTSVFLSTTSTQAALKSFLANAKKTSLRRAIAEHLNALYIPPPATLVTPKLKTPHNNPYLDFWEASCHVLKWAGPDPGTKDTKISHALLPVFYHHFGCIVPTFEALHVITSVAKARPIIDLGSGTGYWTYMLRRMTPKPPTVIPIDSGHSIWRTTWIGDTIAGDGIKFLASRDGGRDDVLLLVYPQVSEDFTGRAIRAFHGDTLVVAGTQVKNGFTGFPSETVDEWMIRERPEMTLFCRIPLPSFAGKDEALFVFQRGYVKDQSL